jgi:hypothetical protein
MATKERTIEDTHCDRCDKRVATHRDAVVLLHTGVESVVGRPVVIDTRLELCKGCESSLRKWWARGKAGEE